MGLQLRARAKAVAHLFRNFGEIKHHQVWRVYRWLGLDTQRIFCSCGLEFTQQPAGSPSVADMLAIIADLRRARDGR